MTSFKELTEKIKFPGNKWEHLRHPHAGWLRIILVAFFPFVVWSHNIIFIPLWLIAAIGQPWWFPAYVESTGTAPLFTRIVDNLRLWLEATPLKDKALGFLPFAAMLLPLVCALWVHLFFWSLYFYAATIACQITFLRRILNHKE